MAEPTAAAAEVVSVPAPAQIERAVRFTREPFVLEGERPADALAPGSPRRRAFDAALAEIEAGAEHPSVEWRRTWSFLLGLERLLSEDDPKLADGATLDPHQVDALSGTLTALIAEGQRSNGNGSVAVPPEGNGAAPPPSAELAEEDDEIDAEEDDEPDEPQDWEEEAEVDEDVAEAPVDPNEAKRFWFEHAT